MSLSDPWPPPAPDPPIEPGENRAFHLLPDLDRLRALTPAERAELVELVADWEGPLVVTWRERARAFGLGPLSPGEGR